MPDKKYIELEAAIKATELAHKRLGNPYENIREVFASIPAADVVSRGAYDQTDWERCVALTQLKEIGKSFGERMDDVRPVILCGECKFWGRECISCEGLARCNTGESGVRYRNRNDFCSRGIKMEES